MVRGKSDSEVACKIIRNKREYDRRNYLAPV